jgi:hypothetical protein
MIDMVFALFTGMRDGLLNWLDMNYGFIEFEICKPFKYSFRFQGVLHDTSLLLKTFLSVRTLLLFAYPMKVRFLPLKKWAAVILFGHVVFCGYFVSAPAVFEIVPVTTVQEFKRGRPLKIIRACVLKDDMEHLSFLSSFSNAMSYVHFTFFLINIIIPCVNTIILWILMRRQIKAVSVLASHTKKPVKYLQLMKISIFLGISFVVQEIPQVILQALLFGTDLPSVRKFHSISSIVMTLSFAIGKPVDLIIYSMQSEAFRSKFVDMKCRSRKT